MFTHSAIQTIVNSLLPANNFTTVESEPEFAKKVRLTSVLLKTNSPISYTDIRRSAEGAYHEIALRISTAKYTNTRIDFQWTDEDIIAMMTPNGAAASTSSIARLGAFSGGIEWAAVKLTAALVINNIPLSSTLKFTDISERLQKTAEENIERIIKLLNSSIANDTSKLTDENIKGQAYLYIAHSLDLNTIPEVLFNIPDKDSNPPSYILPIDFDDPNLAPPIEVETVNTLKVPINHVGICYFYMTGQSIKADQDLITSRNYNNGLEGDPQNSRAVSYKIEKAFKILNHNEIVNIDSLITQITDEINTETLNVTNNYIANILTAPDRGPYKTTIESINKRELYPATTSLKNRKATFSLYHHINKLSFDVRRYSSKSTTEILTIAFYTVPISIWETYELSPMQTNDVRLLKNSGLLGIEGLIFGSQNTYSALNNNVPYSALLNVEKGNIAAVSIEQEGGGLNPSVNDANSNEDIDTFYFRSEENAFSSDLILRATTTSYLKEEEPLDIKIDLTVQPFTIPLNPNDISIGEQISNRVVDAIYKFTRETNINTVTKDNSNILGVLLGDYQRTTTIFNKTTGTANEIPLEYSIDNIYQNKFTGINPERDSLTNEPIGPSIADIMDSEAGRVQIVGFKYRNEEYRIVLEIKSLPSELWVATGNYIVRKTQWVKGIRRAITITTKTLKSNTVDVETKSEELASVKASVSKIEASKSKLLQSVFDKRSLLKNAQTGFINKW